jgi:hypothetical protein
MDAKLREELEEILALEDDTTKLIREALEYDIPPEDADLLKKTFKQSAIWLEQVFGRVEANTHLPWLLFSIGVVYGRRQ